MLRKKNYSKAGLKKKIVNHLYYFPITTTVLRNSNLSYIRLKLPHIVEVGQRYPIEEFNFFKSHTTISVII